MIFQKIKNYFPFCHPRAGGGPDATKRLDLRLRGNDKKKEFVLIQFSINEDRYAESLAGTRIAAAKGVTFRVPDEVGADVRF